MSHNFKLYQFQISGHRPLLQHGHLISKPFQLQEYQFYRDIHLHRPLLQYLPICYGYTSLSIDDYRHVDNESSVSVASELAQREVTLTGTYLLLRNLTFQTISPCMIDIKMGTIQTPNTVDPARYHHQQTKCLNSTSSVVGYRLAGLSYHNYNNPHLSVFRDKYWGRLIPADQLEPILHSFFSQSQSTVPILESFLHDLNEIISFLLTDEGKAITFIGVSVHLLYDLSTNPPKIGLHLIDFNSCTHSPPTFDTGFLKGLESLRTHLSSVMKILTSESPTQGSFFGGSLDLRFRDEGIENRQLIQKKKIERRIAQQKGNK